MIRTILKATDALASVTPRPTPGGGLCGGGRAVGFRNSNWARYRKEISDNIKNSRLAVVLGFGPALRWGRPDSFQEPGPRFRRDVGFVSDALPDRIGFAVAADTLFGLIFFRCAVARTCLADRGGPGRDRRRVLDLICLDWP
jgi:hypothetical protein